MEELDLFLQTVQIRDVSAWNCFLDYTISSHVRLNKSNPSHVACILSVPDKNRNPNLTDITSHNSY